MGVEWGYLDRNPARAKAVRAPHQIAPDIRPFDSWEQVSQATRAAGDYEALIVFACATGLRPEEWIPLQWSDSDLTNRALSMNKVCVDGVVRTSQGKTVGAFRQVELQQLAVDALNSLPRPIRSDSLIFPAPRGGLINLDNWRRRVWHPALKAAHLEARPLYQMRHTYATLGLTAGADIYWISKQLGHEDIRMTLRHYARFQRSVDERNIRARDDFAVASA